MITVKQYIKQQVQKKWDLNNPFLSELQNNEVVLIDDEIYINANDVFDLSQKIHKITKKEDFEVENKQLHAEVEHLLAEYEKVFVRNESLQNLVTNLQRSTKTVKHQDLKTDGNDELMFKIKKISKENDELSEKLKAANEEIITLRAEKKEALLDAKTNRAILLMQEDKEEKQTSNSELEKLQNAFKSLQEQNRAVIQKNNKLRHAAQFFGDVSSTIQKLNAQVIRAKASFDKTGVDLDEL